MSVPKKMQHQIRKPEVKDLPQINQLFAETIRDNFLKEGIDDPNGTASKTEIESLQNAIQNHFALGEKRDNHYLISTYDEKILGTIAYGKVSKLIFDNLKIDYTNTPEIKSVYVLPDHQNKGVGRQLMQNILVALQKENITHFCLDSGYQRAQGYWSKNLGEPRTILRDHWAKGAHHMIWHCAVSEVLASYDH